MLKAVIVLSALAVAMGQEYQFNNMIDFEDSPYQRISLPYYRYHGDGEKQAKNIQSKTTNNKKIDVVELPATLLATRETNEREEAVEENEAKTSLTIKSSIISTLYSVASKFFGLAKTGLSLLVQNAPALILGAVAVVGFCKVTSVCTKVSSIQSLKDAQEEFNRYITPERMDMATEFVQEAIRRYRSIQTN